MPDENREKGPGSAQLADWIREQTAQNVGLICDEIRSPLGVLPFVGAGLSAPFGFPGWGTLLGDVSRGLPRGTRAAVTAAVDRSEFLKAASVAAQELGEADFQRAIALRFSDDLFEGVDLARTAVELVPHLASGLVITTNFDGVLEYVFERSGARFADCVLGANPTQVIPAIQQNQRVLWKIHGDRRDGRTRVFNDEDYQKHYQNLDQLLSLALSNRPAFFLGSSLEKDRTVEVLRSVQQMHPGLTHFALLAAPADEAAYETRSAELRALGVRPIWFLNPDGRFTEIRARLLNIVQCSSTRRASVAPRGRAPVAPVPAVAGAGATVDGGAALREELAEVAREAALDQRAASAPPAPDPGLPFVVLLDHLKRGEVVFFLGAAAMFGRLPLAREFYGKLRMLIAAPPELSDERVVQHFVDVHGRGGLDATLRDLLDGAPVKPTALHWLLGTLTARLRAKGYSAPEPLFMTTNFDQTLERVLTLTGQRYHLFTYRLVPPHEGQFVYRTPDGELLAVDRPEGFRHALDDHPIVVKYHGGLHDADPLPLTYAVADSDFVHTAKHLPQALPRTVRDRIRRSALAFLGSSLRTTCVEALAREVHRARSQGPSPGRSWAIQRNPIPGQPLYWRPLGVDIIDMDIRRFTLELDRQIEGLRAV